MKTVPLTDLYVTSHSPTGFDVFLSAGMLSVRRKAENTLRGPCHNESLP